MQPTITNLPIVAKIMERLVAGQLQAHLDRLSLFADFPSGFRPGRGTETALSCIWEDILGNADKGMSNSAGP